MARRCTARQWDEVVRGVTAAAALSKDYKVTVRRTALEGAYGLTDALDIYTGRFVIDVEEDLTEPHAAEILIHEFAHVLDWRLSTEWVENHGPTFWIYFGQIWRRYHQVM